MRDGPIYHALKAWYIGKARKHDRALKGVTDLGAVRLTDTWKFKHHSLTVPTITATDRIVKATQDLTTAIGRQNKAPPDFRSDRGPQGAHLWEQRRNPPTATGTGTRRPTATTFLTNRDTAPGYGRKSQYTTRPIQRRNNSTSRHQRQ